MLLTGSATTAEAALVQAIEDGDDEIDQCRSAAHCNVFLFTQIRTECLKRSAPAEPREEPAEADAVEAAMLARHFHGIPEPERTALALFYLDALDSAQIARFLGCPIEQLADMLERARTLLQNAISAPPAA